MTSARIDQQLSNSVVPDPETIAGLRELIHETRPVSAADERLLPMLPALEDLLPERGLRRGSTVQVAGVGATSLALAVSAGPSRSGSWVACIGLPELGWSTAAELGVDLHRIVVVRAPERSFATVAATLIDAFDVVLCGMTSSISTTEARRLTSRIRDRGSVLLLVGAQSSGCLPTRRMWPEPTDVNFAVTDTEWAGVGQGDGRLKRRRVTVQVEGRRALNRPRQVELWLPGTTGSAERFVARPADRYDFEEGSGVDGVDSRDVDSGGVVVPLRRAG